MKPIRTAVALAPSTSTRAPRICLQCSFQRQQRRQLSRTASRHAAFGQMNIPRRALDALPAEASRSRKAMMKNIPKDQIPTDLGLLPGTLVAPPFSQLMPLLWKSPRRYFNIQWLRLKKSTIGFASLFYQLKWNAPKDKITGKKLKRPPMLLRKRAVIAEELHRGLGNAIARDDSGWLRENACGGLSQKLRKRIDARRHEKRPPQSWMVEYGTRLRILRWSVRLTTFAGLRRRVPWPLCNLIPLRAVKPVSDVLVPIPIGKGSHVRQAICKIESTQSLQTPEKDGRRGVQVKHFSEYVVIQQMNIEGQDGPWMIWGTVQPSSDNEIDKLILGDGSTSALRGIWDTFKTRMSMAFRMGGM